MSQIIKVDLQFNANTQNAKNAMKELQTQLTALSQTSLNTQPLNITPQLQQAEQSAMRLKIALNAAFNQDTGKLNLGKFQAELNRSGMNLKTMAANLKMLGPAGIQAFQQMTQQIVQADTKMFSLTGKAKSLMDTFGSAMKWSIAYGALTKFTQGIRSTIDFTKELDQSLNNIRIVTGKNANEMARFAKNANEMAKTLSTSTKAYSDASLIYFQQGLSDSEVKEKTATTVKLANVTGESAQTVSDWMTAIWNNFDDGSQKVEYFADVIAKLGAETASSADEIATGLEKFAAIADTVGLSYEYATSALATVTAETRQSAEVVGTAFKTLFARMEGLKLGETLDDGTTLNQYSLALESVGVNIKDANGELKNMDTILSETGNRWSSLTKDQQVALSQSVAGIRQYAQFMALMDNWDVMQENLERTEKATGALEIQQEIYEESLKAREEKMKAAGDSMKMALFGTEEMEKVYDFGAEAFDLIANLLEAFGGLKTILLGVAAALMKIYQPQITNFFSQVGVAMANFGQKAAFLFTGGKHGSANPNQDFKNQAIDLNAEMIADQDGKSDALAVMETKHSRQQADLQRTLLANQDKMTEAQKQEYEWKIKLIQAQQEEIEKAQAALDIETQKNQEIQSQINSKGFMTSNEAETFSNQVTSFGKGIQSGENAVGYLNKIKENVPSGKDLTSEQRQEIVSNTRSMMNYSGQAYADMGVDLNSEKLANQLGVEQGSDGATAYSNALDSVEKEFKEGNISTEQYKQRLEEINRIMNQFGGEKLQDIRKDALVGADLQNDEKFAQAGQMANLAYNASVDDVEAAVGNTDYDMVGMNGEKTTVQGEIEGIKAEQVKVNEDYAKSQENLNKVMARSDKSTDDYKKALNDANKAVKKSEAAQKNLQKRTENLVKAVKKQGNENRKSIKENNKSKKSFDELAKGNEKAAKSVDELTKSSLENGKSMANNDANIQKINKDVDNLSGSMNKAGTGFSSFAQGLSTGLGQFASYAMGISMITSAVESLSSSLASGETSWKDWVSAISSVAMSLTMLLPQIISVTTGVGNMVKAKQQDKMINEIINKQGLVDTNLKRVKLALAAKEHGASKQEIQDDYNEATANVVEALTENSKNAGKGPVGWAMFAAGLAMILPIAAMVGVSASSGSASGGTAAKSEEVEKGTESLQAIDENQELAKSVTDLTEEYNALRDSGESTADVLDKMREKIPELIDSYKELSKTMGTHLDTSELEKAYENFLATGDTTMLEKAQEKLDNEVAQKEESTAKTTINNARDLAMDAAREGDGAKNGSNFEVEIGDSNLSDSEDKETRKILKDSMGSHWDDDSNMIKFDMTNEADIIEGYNAMIEARDQLMAAGYTNDNNDYLREINREISEMSEQMPNLIAAHEQLFEIQKEAALLEEENFNKENGLNKIKINNITDYEEKRKKLIEKLKEENKWTEDQAVDYLANSEAYGTYEETYNYFKKGGLGFSKDMSKSEVAKVKQWFSELPEEDRTFAMNIDFTTVDNLDEAKEALDEIRRKAEEASIYSQAEELKVDTATFDSYVEGLASVNDQLDENSNLAKQAALNNLKMSKGLETLTKSWDDNYDIIKRGNKASLEYAEAMGQVKTAFKEMYGVQPSTEYIEKYSKEINEMVNGNLDSLETLQDALAEDYILNMEYNSAVDLGKGVFEGTLQDAQTTLTNMIKDLDTSIEVGEGAYLSEDYLNTVQDMLDSGVITSEQLQNIFRAKGYEMEITGWDEIDGPVKTITQTTYDGKGKKTGTKTIKESEKIKVPIINGDSSRIKTLAAGKTEADVEEGLSYSKSTDKRLIDTSAAEEKAEKRADSVKEAKESIEDEKDTLFEEKEAADALAKSFDRISKAKEHAYGADKIALGKQERANLQDQIEANETLIKGYENLAESKRKALASDFGAQFDADGNMTNYEEVFNILSDRVIAAKEAEDDKAIKAAEENFEAFKDMYGEYNEYRDEQQAKELENIDKQAEIIQSRLDDIDYIVELQVQVNDTELEELERRIELLDRGENWDIAKIMSITGEQAQIYTNKSSDYLDAARNVLEEKGLSDKQINKIMSGDAKALKKAGLSPEELEAFQGYIQSAKEESRSGLDAVYDGLDKVAEYREGLIEDIDELASRVGDFKSQVEALSTIADLTGKNTGQVAENLRKASAEAAKANTAIAKTKYETLTAQAADLEEEIKNTTDETAKAILQQQLDNINSQIPGVLGEFYSAVADEMQVQIDNYNAELKETLEGMSREMWNGMTSSELQEAYDRQKELKELYLTEYEKTYQLNKLTRNLQAEIDKTDNVQSQKQLNRLLEKANLLYNDDVKLSENQLKVLEKEIEAEKALIALEEGKNAKSKVQLQKNALGGYSYVYTADQDNVSKLQQAYEDSMYAYNEAMTQMLEGSESAIVSLYGQWEEALMNLDVTAEDYQKKMEEVNAHYTALIEYHTGQIDWGLAQSNDLIQQHGQNYSGNLTAMEISTETWLSNFSDMFIGEGYESASGLLEKWVENVGTPDQPGKTLGKIKTNFDNLESKLNDILNTNLKGDLDTFGETINKLVNGGDGEDGIVDHLGGAEKGAEDLATKLSELKDVDLSDWADTLIGNEKSGLKGIEEAAVAAQQAISELNKMEIKDAKQLVESNYTTGSDKTKFSGKVKIKSGKTANLNQITGGNFNEGTGTLSDSKIDLSDGSGWTYTGNTVTKKYDNGDTREFAEIKNSEGQKYYIATGNLDLPKTQQKTKVPSTSGSEDKDISTNPPVEPKNDVDLSAPDENEGYTVLSTTSQRGRAALDLDYYKRNGKTISRIGDGHYGYFYVLKDKLSKDSKGNWRINNNTKSLNIDDMASMWYGDSINSDSFDDLGSKEILTYNKNGEVDKTRTLPDNKKISIKEGNEDHNLLELSYPGTAYQYRNETYYGPGHTVYVKYYDFFNAVYSDSNETVEPWRIYNGIVHYNEKGHRIQFKEFDTGGYTGSWGPEGKMAMLHQKEIVLNASDTSNFLEAIKLVRQIASQIDLQAASMSSSAFANILSTFNVSGPSGTLDQNVTIHAEFPNVTQHSEIEQAFENLVNKASQFANRK